MDMRLIEGRDLETVPSHGPLETGRAVNIIMQVAAALQAAHRVGLHRDVKPSNIRVARISFAYSIDFGIAQAARRGPVDPYRHDDRYLGLHMAPEPFAAGQTDDGTDVYALACVLHQALTGDIPIPAPEEQIHDIDEPAANRRGGAGGYPGSWTTSSPRAWPRIPTTLCHHEGVAQADKVPLPHRLRCA